MNTNLPSYPNFQLTTTAYGRWQHTSHTSIHICIHAKHSSICLTCIVLLRIHIVICHRQSFLINMKKIVITGLLFHGTFVSHGLSLQGGNLSKSTLRIIHPKYGTEIILIGCLHGSSSSKADVQAVLNTEPETDVVALELCPTRYKDLKKDMEKRIQKSDSGEYTRFDDYEKDDGFLRMVSKTTESKGIATGLAALILGGTSIISTKLSGFEAGAEFVTAIEYVESRKDSFCDVILADTAVDETLKGVGSIPMKSFEMMRSYVLSGLDWDSVYVKNASVLSTAVGATHEEGIPLLKLNLALIRNRGVVTDIARLLIPNYVLIELINAVSTFSFGDVAAAAANSGGLDTISEVASATTLSQLMSIIYNVFFQVVESTILLSLGYLLFVLPTTGVILTDRDVQLSNGIEDACKIASLKKSNGGKVVAVLGFLHVNGVAKTVMTQV